MNRTQLNENIRIQFEKYPFNTCQDIIDIFREFYDNKNTKYKRAIKGFHRILEIEVFKE